MVTLARGSNTPAGDYGVGNAVMANGQTLSLGGAGAAIGARALGAAGLALLVSLGACSPVATWRNLTGVSKNDPNPATTPNTKNLAAGEAYPYPNLATVPPPPTREMTTAELSQLTQSLVGDRANAKYTDQQVRAGSAAVALPPAQSAAVVAAPTGVTLAATPSVRAAPVPAPKIPVAIAQPITPAAPSVAGPASPAAIAAATPQASQTTKASAVPGTATPNGMESGLRKPGQPHEPGPMESSLVSPQIPETPQPEALEAAPPPPRLVAMPAVSGSTPAHLPPPPAAVPPPVGAAAYQPPPASPVLASPAPTRTAVPAPAGETQLPAAAAATPLADIIFAAGSKSLSDSDVEALKRVATLYREHPRKLRVVGYVGVAAATDPLASFSTALDRAQAVAAALVKTGIPAAKIAVEASPTKSATAGEHAEVLIEH
jgi:outer membrane protein OmpA-like peptidoglycan-associated protein